MALRLFPASRTTKNFKNILSSGVFGAPSRSVAAQASLAETIHKYNADNTVMVYSKSYCPYCAQVRELFGGLQVNSKFLELDNMSDGAEIQAELLGITGSRTVPQVFIAGEFIGGASETMALHMDGGLLPKFEAAGVSYVA